MQEVREAVGSIATERVVELAMDLCRVPAPLGGEGPLAERVAKLLDRPRIDVHVQEVAPGRPNVIGTVKGRGAGPALLLNAHLDAAVAPGWSHDPYDPWVEGNRLHGGGLTDMKGSLAAMIVSLRTAAEGGTSGDLILHAVIAHNPTGLGTKFALASELPISGYGICGQGSALEIHTTNGGAIKWEIGFEGRAAHVSAIEAGRDALAAASDVAQALRSFTFTHTPHDRLRGLPRFVVGELIAGGAAQIPALLPGSGVADRAFIRGDVRTVPGMDRWTVRADLDALLARVCPEGIKARTRVISEVKPFLGPEAGPLVEALSRAHELVRGEPVRFARGLPASALVMDGPDLLAHGLPTVMYGPGPWRYMADEYVEMDQLGDAARIYLATALLLSSGGGPPLDGVQP